MRIISKAAQVFKNGGFFAFLRQCRTHVIYRLMHCLPKNDWGDKLFALGLFYISHGRLPLNEFLFNDFMYYMKTSGELNNPLRVFVSDKEFVKIYVKARVGDAYNVPTLAVLRSAEEVDAYDFPPNCCVKPTHASGQVLFVSSRGDVDRVLTKAWLRENYYHGTREVNYKSLRPKVIVEPLIFKQTEPTDYKYFCMNGRVKFVQIDVQRQSDHQRLLIDREWNVLPFSIHYPLSKAVPVKPSNWSEMIEVAEALSDQFSFVRVDMYSDGDQCLVGEITNCQGNAGEKFLPSEGEAVASALLFNPEKK